MMKRRNGIAVVLTVPVWLGGGCLVPERTLQDVEEQTDGGTDSAMAGNGGADSSAGGSAGSAGYGGTAGDDAAGGGGAGGNSGAGGEAGAPGCPADMVQISPAGYCIDATEVTRTAYAEWLGTSPTTTGQPSACSFNADYIPSVEWPPDAMGQHPVVGIDWCDAYAYCIGVGKRLCGKIGGGDNAYADIGDASKSQWFNACSKGWTQPYPYGQAYDPQKCNTKDTGIGHSVATGSLLSCEGGYPGIFDLSGNVWEWEDSCDGAGMCHARGGAFNYAGETWAKCVFYVDGSPIAYRGNDIGFRCCSDL